jgi:hypothetical protein
MALFGGGKPDHPMADIKQAKKLIAELPAGDAFKALEDVTFWLDSIARTPEFKAEYRFELYDLLDQAAKNHQRKLSQEYLQADRQQKFVEARIWKAVFEFWKGLGDGYIQCIEQFQTGAGGGIKNELPIIVARALRTVTLQLKWVLLRYGPVAPEIWGDIGRLYQFAESRGFVSAIITIYPGAHGTSSVQQEFLKALMLGVSSTDGLSPVEQEIVERIVAHFGSLFTVQDNPTDASNYFFDCSMRQLPARVIKSTGQSPTTRFFGAGHALPALHKLMQDIKLKDGVPSDVHLGGEYDTALVLSVLQHLALYWADEPPARSTERRKIATRLTVVHGYQKVIAMVADSEEASLDFGQQDGTESWIVENISDGGYGAIIPQVKGDWVRLGSLLGLKAETSKFWGAGVIRRITRDEYQQRRVGIQVLSKAVIPVRLSPTGNVSSVNATRQGDQAILLSSTPDAQGEVELLMKVGSYTAGQSLEMHVRKGKSYLLMPSKLIEGADDFDWAKFKVMQRD